MNDLGEFIFRDHIMKMQHSEYAFQRLVAGFSKAFPAGRMPILKKSLNGRIKLYRNPVDTSEKSDESEQGSVVKLSCVCVI